MAVENGRRGTTAVEEDRMSTTAIEEDRMSTMAVEEDRRGTMAVEEDRRGTTAAEENRRMRALQDEEYDKMLRADQDKIIRMYSTYVAVVIYSNSILYAMQHFRKGLMLLRWLKMR